MVYKIVFNLHVIVSLVTILAGIFTVTRSVIGWRVRTTYGNLDFRVSQVFSTALYLQLLLGFIIYVLLRSFSDNPLFSIPGQGSSESVRFWAIEHIALMIFALFLSQLGRLYIKRSVSSIKRHRASVFYYGTSLFLILFSLSIVLVFN